MAADATMMSWKSWRLSGELLEAIAPMSQMTGRSASMIGRADEEPAALGMFARHIGEHAGR